MYDIMREIRFAALSADVEHVFTLWAKLLNIALDTNDGELFNSCFVAAKNFIDSIQVSDKDPAIIHRHMDRMFERLQEIERDYASE